MSFWTFVFMCVLAGMAYDLYRKKNLAAHGHWEDDRGRIQPLHSADESALQRELQDLRERVKVLERIATDEHDPKRLSAEIERLRDK
ncbi:MAG: hypothetical protein RLZZ08_1783 [Pseudomonadota bacterium]|jgi:hypothetical protein